MSFFIHACAFVILLLIGFANLTPKLKVFLLVFFYTLFFGFRESFGNDYYQYISNFDYIISGSQSESITFEPLFIILANISAWLLQNDGYRIVFAVYSGLTFFIFLVAVSRFGNICYAVPLFYSTGFVFYANNQIRQALATSIFLWSIQFVNVSKVRFFATNILSTIAHFSSLALALLCFVPRNRLNNKAVLLFSLIVFFVTIFNLAPSLFIKFVDLVPHYGEIYHQRVEELLYKSNDGTNLNILYNFVFSIVIYFIYSSLFSGKIANIYLLGCFLYFVFINLDLLERFFYQIYLIQILLVVKLLSSRIKIYQKNIVVLFLFGSLFICFVQIFCDLNKNGSVPFNHLLWSIT